MTLSADEHPLCDRWELARLPAGLSQTPADLPPDLPWVPAIVPGTAAAALGAAGLWREPEPLHDQDVWYRGIVRQEGEHRLTFAGLATVAEVWLDGVLLLRSDNMFLAHAMPVTLQAGAPVHLCFRSLYKALAGRRGRPRWRPRLATPATLRSARTTLLGHMPGWCPTVHAVGPWRPITALPLDETPRLVACDLRPTLTASKGRLDVRLEFSRPVGDAATLWCAGFGTALRQTTPATLEGTLDLDGVEPWWPHTHGTPHRHEVSVDLGGRRLTLGTVGFRSLHIDRGPHQDGFTLVVNGVPIFCRGAAWTSADLVGLDGSAETYAPWLQLARDGGLNMIRVTGLGVYEGDAFYALCDRLGLLVWQDFMFANFDYPAGEPAFMASATAEAEQFLSRTRRHACLAILCGGSEIDQQAAMLGLAEAARGNALFDTVLPQTIAQLRPDVPYVPHTPWGRPLPFLAGRGVTHYYGVGAYLRPLEDARRAHVRFASECLAFANVPDDWTVSRVLGVAQTHDPRWKAAVPRDVGASWDFEDVRDHYLQLLFGVDPLRTRYETPDRYLELSRAVSADVIAQTLAEWRRPGSGCGGALVFQFQDLRPGAGWGIVDSEGRPKAAWHGLRQASRPVQLLLTDEGLNGLGIHVVNDRPTPLAGSLRLSCLRDGREPAATGTLAVSIPARGGGSFPSSDLLAGFFDVTYAYRFGPPAHDTVLVELLDADGQTLDEAFYFPPGTPREPVDLGLEAALERRQDDWVLVASCRRTARFVHVQDPHFRAEAEWFHMAPDRPYLFRLLANRPENRTPGGDLLALNGLSGTRYGA